MSKKDFKTLMNENNIKIRSLTNLAGCLLTLSAALLFVLLIDVVIMSKYNSNISVHLSSWLFLAIIFAGGGAIFYFFGDSVKHKPGIIVNLGLKIKVVPTLWLKMLGIILAIGFIPFLYVFQADVIYTKGALTSEVRAVADAIMYSVMAIDIVGIVAFIINYVFSIIYIKEDY